MRCDILLFGCLVSGWLACGGMGAGPADETTVSALSSSGHGSASTPTPASTSTSTSTSGSGLPTTGAASTSQGASTEEPGETATSNPTGELTGSATENTTRGSSEATDGSSEGGDTLPESCAGPIVHMGDLNVDDETILEDFACVVEITGRLRIENTKELTHFSPLAAVREVGDRVDVRKNLALDNLDGLAGLERVGCIANGCASYVRVAVNPLLTDVSGLKALVELDSLILHDNDLLTSLTGVRLDFMPFAEPLPALSIVDNDALKALTGISGDTLFTGSLVISGNDKLADISQLGPLLGKSLGATVIENNPALVDLVGLDGVTTISEFSLTNNDGLLDLHGLESLTTLTPEGVVIRGNDALTTFEGLGPLSLVGAMFLVDSNPSLISLAALAELEEVTGTLQIGSCIGDGNDALPNLSGLSALTHADRLVLDGNAAIGGVTGLSALNSLTVLWAMNNPALSSNAVNALALDLQIDPMKLLNCNNKGNPGECPCPDANP